MTDAPAFEAVADGAIATTRAMSIYDLLMVNQVSRIGGALLTAE